MGKSKNTQPSTNAVDPAEKATGKPFKEWFSYLDKHQAGGLIHKEIVAIVAKELDNSWWCQKITVAYEQHKGKRILGQTSDSRFQIGVSKTLPVGAAALCNVVFSEKGMAIWLGKTGDLNTGSQKDYHTNDGIRGELTVFNSHSHMRLTWQRANWSERSVLQVRVTPKGEKSILSFHHEKLPNAAERENMKAYWTDKIAKLAKLVAVK